MSENPHGTSGFFHLGGVLTAIVVNALFVAGIAYAAGSQAAQRAEEAAEDSGLDTFQCTYFQDQRAFQVEVKAGDWHKAEERVCGLAWSGVRVPPMLMRGYLSVHPSPASDGVVLSQRESCSCGDEQRLVVIKDVGIVEAPRLGTEPKRRSLPEIVNNPEQVERDVVDPDAKPRKRRRKDRKLKHEKPKFNELIDAADSYDPARPENDRKASGEAYGSKVSNSATGQGDLFKQKVKAKLENTMRAPSTVPTSSLKKLEAFVWLKVGATGAIVSWGWKQKSGNQAFDAMVERTIRQFTLQGSASFPQPPMEWRNKRLTVHVDGSRIR